MRGESAEAFGCDQCWSVDAGATWHFRQAFQSEAELVDEPHYHVMILACGVCGQRFLSVMIESVDWAGGDDSQHWSLLPLTAEEAAKLRLGSSDFELEALAPGRRSLRRDHPAGGVARSFWSTGVATGPHD